MQCSMSCPLSHTWRPVQHRIQDLKLFDSPRPDSNKSSSTHWANVMCNGFIADWPAADGAQISAVVWMFSYPLRTALAVGLSMAQIGEFAFVLLSVASHQGLLAYQVYMLLMGARWPVLRPKNLTLRALCFATWRPATRGCLSNQGIVLLVGARWTMRSR